MIELTQEQLEALDRQQDRPPRLLDPRTQRTYVLLGADAYERLRGVLEDDGLDMWQVAVLVEQAMREYDEDDPLLQSYQKDSELP